MKKALLVIDYTYDFVADGGALTCGEPAQELFMPIFTQIKSFIKEQELVMFINDVHEINDTTHPETKLFPPHNIRGTKGSRIFLLNDSVLVDTYERALKSVNKEAFLNDHVKYMDKTRYSAFHNTDLDERLKEKGINEIHLAGVCTDICILHTAVDAYNKGYNVIINEDCVASFNQQGHEWALNHFENSLGFKVNRK